VERKDVRILVVDDEPVMADSLKQNLVEEGYTVDTAANGTEAIEMFDRGGHHIAVCDLQLPDVDGLEVLKHIKDTRPSTEVIVVTGYGRWRARSRRPRPAPSGSWRSPSTSKSSNP
jgi:Response regulator containing CheY-like receiver, AAA-type ATPase, and DNA-binding domains